MFQIILCFQILYLFLNIATQCLIIFCCTVHPFYQFYFISFLFYNSFFLFLFRFSFTNMIYRKFILNLSTFCHLLYYNFSPHLISSSSFLPSPTPNLPPPISLSLRLAEANSGPPFLSTQVEYGQWIVILLYFVYFLYIDICKIFLKSV